jgi:hypothetical protein
MHSEEMEKGCGHRDESVFVLEGDLKTEGARE